MAGERVTHLGGASESGYTQLTCTRAGEALAAFVRSSEFQQMARRAGANAALAGADFQWQVKRVHDRPGQGWAVVYTLTFGGEDLTVVAANARGARHEEVEFPPFVYPLRGSDETVLMWLMPFDPWLPELARALDPRTYHTRISGVETANLRAYRPTRRAVIELHAEGGRRAFAKVSAGEGAEQLALRLKMLDEAQVPAPRLVHVNPGLVVTTGVPGIRLSAALRDPRFDAAALRADIAGILERLPESALQLEPRRAWVERADRYAHAVARAFPELAGEAQDLALEIAQIRGAADEGPLAVVHGDLYDANILVDPATGLVSGIIDADGLGPGRAVHDWGCVLGHLVVLDSLESRRYAGFEAIAGQWLEDCAQSMDERALRASLAGVVLSLVPGARLTANPLAQARTRLARAREWVQK